MLVISIPAILMFNLLCVIRFLFLSLTLPVMFILDPLFAVIVVLASWWIDTPCLHLVL